MRRDRQPRDDFYQVWAQLDTVAESRSPQATSSNAPAPQPLQEVLKAVSTVLGDAASIVQDRPDGTLKANMPSMSEPERRVACPA